VYYACTCVCENKERKKESDFCIRHTTHSHVTRLVYMRHDDGRCLDLVLIYTTVCVIMIRCTALVHETLRPVLLGFIVIGVVIRREF